MTGLKHKDKNKEVRYFCIFSMIVFFVAAFCFASPAEIFSGMKSIFYSRDALITDYFELAGYGATFFNAGLVMLMSILLIDRAKIPYTGLTLAAMFINVGFAFWGKNPLNVLPIILGVWIYAKLQGVHFARYIYTALFATCLGPFVTEIVYILPFSYRQNLVIALAVGIFIGFALPPLSMHTASMHMGYSLFNVGFAAGILAFAMFCVLKSFGLESEAVFIWKAERHPAIVVGTMLYFMVAFAVGWLISDGHLEGVYKIMRHPGRAVADFVMMDGPGTTLMNMGIMGATAELYVIVVGGDLSGPIIGSLFTVFGFSAFGAHLRNYLPVMLGVCLSTVFTVYELTSPGILIATLFAVGVSPIAGQFGPIAGIIAGMMHAAIVTCTSTMYGGLNLYNNGFSTGWVAIIMIPLIESFMKHFETRKKKWQIWKENKK